jgi:dihydrolipoamide dehydrogenase
MEKRNVVIIGGGPAGYAAAVHLSQLGNKVTVIEKESLGGTCLNRGCVPAMVMAKAAEALDQGRGAKDFGITFADPSIDFDKLKLRRKTVTKIHVGGVKSLFDAYGVELVQGTARFASPSEIVVTGTDGDQKRFAAEKTIIATGTIAAPATLPGDTGISIDTEQLLEATAPPPSILIMGGNSVALTFATIFSIFGAETTVIEESGRLLPEIDQEIVDMLQRELKKNKIQVISGARPVRLDGGPDRMAKLELEIKGEKTGISGACVLRTGRQANIDGLGLVELGIMLNEKGGVATDRTMQTSVKSIYAAGDVTMNHLCTPVAYREGLTAADNIAGKKSSIDYSAIPYWSSTIPAVCGAGMTEADALAKGHAVRVGRFPMAANGMATVLGKRVGMIKVVTDAKHGEILGVHMLGQNAPELVHEVLLAMKSELTPQDIGAVFHVHPSLAEAFWDAMMAVNGASINSFSPKA